MSMLGCYKLYVCSWLSCIAAIRLQKGLTAPSCSTAEYLSRASSAGREDPPPDMYFGGTVLRFRINDTVSTFAGGSLSLHNPDEITDQSLIEVSSVTKPFVAALILKKILEDPNVHLDTTLGDIYGNEIRTGTAPIQPRTAVDENRHDVTETITLRELMTHTSGIVSFNSPGSQGAAARHMWDWYSDPTLDYAAPWWSPLYWENLFGEQIVTQAAVKTIAEPVFCRYPWTKVWHPRETLKLVNLDWLDSQSFQTLPMRGEFFNSATNYVILGQVVERLYNTTFDKALKDELLDPILGSAVDTFMRYDVEHGRDRIPKDHPCDRRLAHRYSDSPYYDKTRTDRSLLYGWFLPTESFYSTDWASGGMVTSAEELSEFMYKWAVNGTGVYRDIWNMMKASADSAKATSGYGYGIQVTSNDIYYHSGDGGGIMGVQLNASLDPLTFAGFDPTNRAIPAVEEGYLRSCLLLGRSPLHSLDDDKSHTTRSSCTEIQVSDSGAPVCTSLLSALMFWLGFPLMIVSITLGAFFCCHTGGELSPLG